MQGLVLLDLAGVRVLPALSLGKPHVYVAAIRTLFVDFDLTLIEVCDICDDLFPEIIAAEADISRVHDTGG